jgi:hypothetical protein
MALDPDHPFLAKAAAKPPKPPHILVVREDPATEMEELAYWIECPHAAGTPEDHWGDCAYLEECGCSEIYRADRDTFEAAMLRLDVDHDTELEIFDWIDGCVVPLGMTDDKLVADHAAVRRGICLTVADHEDCPKTGQQHAEWDGEIVTPTGPCGLQGELASRGTEIIDNLLPLNPGRYPLIVEHWDEDEGPELAIMPAANTYVREPQAAIADDRVELTRGQQELPITEQEQLLVEQMKERVL